jgi:hypothetical protein
MGFVRSRLCNNTALLSVIVMVCDSVVVTDDFSYLSGGREGGLSGLRSVGGCGFSSPYNQARRKSVITAEQNETCWQISCA